MYEINYYAVLVCGVASMALGMLWYGPLFGKPWMKQVGFTEKDMEEARKKGMAAMWSSMLIAFISSCVMAFVLSGYLSYGGVVDVTKAAIAVAFIWVGFYVTTTISPVLWEKKSWAWFFITIFHQLVQLLIFAAILVSWK